MDIDLNDYFDHVLIDVGEKNDVYAATSFNTIHKNEKNKAIRKISEYDIALIGIPEARNSDNQGCENAPDEIRKKLYRLQIPTKRINIIDLGNLKKGKNIKDTYCGLRDVLAYVLKNNTIPILMGGSQDLTYPNFLAYEILEQKVNIVAVDSRFDLGNSEEEFNSRSYLSKIILEKSSHLFNFSNIGYQTYFINQSEIELMDKLFFDVFRLGKVRENIRETEPIIRDADMLTFDIGAIKQSDAPGNSHPSPNGIYSHEACQIGRYAGMSDRLTSFGLFEVNPQKDNDAQTSHLAAQIIWHFIEGFYSRKKDYPYTNVENYRKFIVELNSENQHIVFYKSPKSQRWWMEVPYPTKKYKKNLLISCSYGDYQKASKQEIPDRWWKFYQKIS